MPRKTKPEPYSTRVLNYPDTMSEYERESLAAEAQLKSERKKSPKSLAVQCPTCGAVQGKKCELSNGQPRTSPHRDRRLIAKDQL
jgi:hypothetical protein